MDIEGPVIDIQRELLARSIYENEVNNVSEILNSSISRAINLNSTITHAMDRCYSTFRGRNQRLRVSGIVSVQTRSVKKFDLACQVAGYRFVYAKDYQFTSGSEPAEGCIELIMCNNVITRTQTCTIPNTIKVDFTDNDISEDVMVFTNLSGERTEEVITDDLNEAVNNGYVLVLTNSGYSIRVVNYNLWIYSAQVELRYISYIEDEVDPNQLTEISGFNPVTADQLITVESVPRQSRLEDKSLVCAYANRYWLSNGVIKSNLDLNEIITSLLTSEPYNCKDVLVVHSLDSDVYSLAIYYTRDTDIIEGEIEEIKNEISTAYYLPSNITITRASISTAVRPRLNEYDQGTFTITIHFNRIIPSQEVSEIINYYENRISVRSLNMYEMMAKIQEISEVLYCEIKATDATSQQDIQINQMVFDLPNNNSHFDLSDVNILYVSN